MCDAMLFENKVVHTELVRFTFAQHTVKSEKKASVTNSLLDQSVVALGYEMM